MRRQPRHFPVTPGGERPGGLRGASGRRAPAPREAPRATGGGLGVDTRGQQLPSLPP